MSKSKPIYTRTGKRQFIKGLMDGMRDDLIAAVPRMPEDWDHVELRELIAVRVRNQVGNGAPSKSLARTWWKHFRRALAAMGAVLLLALGAAGAPGCGENQQVTPDPEAAPLCERYGRQWSGVAQACGVPAPDALTSADLELQRVTEGRGCGAVRYVSPEQVGACVAALEALVPSCSSPDAAGFDAQARALPECAGVSWELLP